MKQKVVRGCDRPIWAPHLVSHRVYSSCSHDRKRKVGLVKTSTFTVYIVLVSILGIACGSSSQLVMLTPTPTLEPATLIPTATLEPPTLAPITTPEPPTSTPVPATLTPAPTARASLPSPATGLNFESGIQGWEAETEVGSRAITSVLHSTEVVKSGNYSLALNVDLKDEGHSKCEGQEPGEGKCEGVAWVELNRAWLSGVEVPLNLEGVPIRVWFFVPRAAEGNPDNANGVQVGVSDTNFNSYFGSWTDLTGRGDTWFAVEIVPSTKAPTDGYVDPGFDPTKVVEIGILIGVGVGGGGSFEGKIYIDEIGW